MIPETLIGAHELQVAGERVLLTTARALLWPAQRALVVADLHIGKAAFFRARGLPVPQGTTEGTLNALSTLIEGCDIAQLYILGDCFHTAQPLPLRTLKAFSAWRERHAGVAITLIRGNHDRAFDATALKLHVVDGAQRVGPFVLRHEFVPDRAGFVFSGHVHPALRLGGRHDALRLPCYWFRKQSAVLPAFGEFTGAADIEPAAHDAVFVITDRQVRALSAG